MTKSVISTSNIEEAVRFHGSSSFINAINSWMKTGGAFKMPQVVTCDIRHTFKTEIGELTVNLGDYVCKERDTGKFVVLSPDQIIF